MVDYYKESIKVETEYVKMGVTLITAVSAALAGLFIKDDLKAEELIAAAVAIALLTILILFTWKSYQHLETLKDNMKQILESQAKEDQN